MDRLEQVKIPVEVGNAICFFFFRVGCDSCNLSRCLINESDIYEERMCAHNYVDDMYTGVGLIDGLCREGGLI